MIKERLNNLRPYVRGVRFVKDMAVVDVVFKDGWDVYENDVVTYKPSKSSKNYFMFFPKDQESSDFDLLLDHIEDIIENNIERENKLVLLKAKVEELKVLFDSNPLSELERLKFKIEDIEEPTLEDLNSSVKEVGNELDNIIHTETDDITNHNGVELPPKIPKEIEEEVIEKEEV